jgi:predicted dehydrogenase
MDEDFMADADTPFAARNEAANGYGALDDFAVHPLSILQTLFGNMTRVMCDMDKPYADRPTAGGERRVVENHDAASVLFHLRDGISGVLMVNRAAWGRKGRIALEIFGSRGSILYDQERMNELQLYQASGRPSDQGYRTILAGPHHPPYDRFIPAPGHGLGFNELKIIECRQLIGRIRGEDTLGIGFDDGLEIERTVHAMARSFQRGRWEVVM